MRYQLNKYGQMKIATKTDYDYLFGAKTESEFQNRYNQLITKWRKIEMERNSNDRKEVEDGMSLCRNLLLNNPQWIIARVENMNEAERKSYYFREINHYAFFGLKDFFHETFKSAVR